MQTDKQRGRPKRWLSIYQRYGSSESFSDKRASASFKGIGTLPEQLTLYIGVDEEGEWNQEDFIKNATKIELTQMVD